jgi:NAD(P)-dependent dehydrogenase (short-subunit alcohol dehydrogenase family)
MERNLAGKAGLITGGASGIGKAAARLFAEAGAAVCIVDLDTALGEALAAELRGAGAQVHFVRCDVSDASAAEAMVAQCIATLGRLDFAFNNAGIVQDLTPLMEGPIEQWDRLIGTNLSSMFYCMKHEMRHMAANGGGAIVNTSSFAGLRSVPQAAAYTAAKQGVVGLSRTAAREGGPDNIRVNVVCPGPTVTAMMERLSGGDSEHMKHLASGVPLGRMATPEDVARAVVWLCGEDAQYISGAVLPIDGALSA